MSAETSAPPITEFRYVDTAIGGLDRRNNVMRLDQFNPTTGTVEAYRTFLCYTEDLLVYLGTNRNEKGKPSVKGYNGLALARFVPVDFDHAADPGAALTDARRFLRRFGERFDVPPEALRRYFSGNKGFSIEIPATLFGGLGSLPARDLAARLKAMMLVLAEGLATLDLQIYEPVRLWRIENSINGKSGRYKIALSAHELLTLPLGDVVALSGAPRSVPHVPDDEWEPRADLAALWQQTTASGRRRPPSAPPPEGARRLTDDQIDGVIDLVAPAWVLGQKHDLSLCLGGYFAKQGIGEDQALAIVERLAAGDERPDDRVAAVRSTYDAHRSGRDVLGYRGLQKLVDVAALLSLDQLVRGDGADHHAGRNGASAEADRGDDGEPTDGRQANRGMSRPAIDAGDQDLERTAAQAWDAIRRANCPERLFRFGGVPVRIEGAEDDAAPIAQTLTVDRMGHELARAAVWFKATEKGGVKPAAPPLRLVKDLLAAPAYPLPPLLGIVQTPVFAPDGSLQTEPGYHAGGKTFFAPSPGFVLPPVPDTPTAADVGLARNLIVDELLGEFCFTDPAEQANAVALFLDRYVRNLIDGPTPLRLVEAPTPGSGKGLLVDVALRPAVGQWVSVMPAASEDAEWAKKITAQLITMPEAIVIDNIVHALDSGALSAALTATWWADRRLGAHEMIRVPVRCAWVATANNPTMSTELARRAVRVRLDPKVDRPWQRTGFRHRDLRGWADAHRGDLVWSALVLGRHWLAEGAPPGERRLGSFEHWSAVLGGILGAAGVDGFLGNLETFYENADLEGAVWRQFVAAWFEAFGEAETGVSELFDLAANVDGFDFGKGSERAQKTAFGLALNRQRDRVIGEFRVVNTRTVQRAKRWRLIKARSSENPFAAFYEQAGDEQAPGEDDDDPWRD